MTSPPPPKCGAYIVINTPPLGGRTAYNHPTPSAESHIHREALRAIFPPMP